MASRERIVAAGDAERRRLERNLHDGAQQRLVALAMQLRLIQADIRRDPAAAEARVTTASDELAESLGELRELARGMHPAVLDLRRCIHHLGFAGSAPRSSRWRGARRCRPRCQWDVSRPPARRRSSWRPTSVACESLANVAKYAQATAASVHLSRGPTRSIDRSRSPTTGWAERTRRPAPGCAASPTASRRSAATCYVHGEGDAAAGLRGAAIDIDDRGR